MKNINGFVIKVVAILTMTIDHIGFKYREYLMNYAVFNQDLYLYFRTIGRLAFPLFAFGIANGYKHTRNVYKYMMNLLGFALITEFAFYVFQVNFPGRNIFYTLFLGLLSLHLIEKRNYLSFMVLPIMFVAEYLHTDYGMYGILLIIIFYYFEGIVQISLVVFLNVIFIMMFNYSSTQFYSLASLLLIHAYNGKQGLKLNKYVFYAYYPVHFIVIQKVFEKLSYMLK